MASRPVPAWPAPSRLVCRANDRYAYGYVSKRMVRGMSGLEELLIRQGAMFLGFIVLIGVSYMVCNALVKKD
ncbi:hypothetical protein SAMN05421543_1052 [Alicyclobacillus macrosporangiidus]|uniref:Uncharacterized protein n=1 Tax=Alicyclobacillus macrosporangiidus TaxID=392015 RepID=A0A1I7HN56_9BACL|nr:hypothetical protein SAMN05421543_1052 [Alicyclobacillus macrosporangiidus]